MHVGDENSPANLRNTPNLWLYRTSALGLGCVKTSWRGEPIRAAGTCFSRGGWRVTSSIPPYTSACRARARVPGSAGPDVPQLEKLITDWVRAGDETKRKQLASEVQKVALSEVTYVPWGEWFQPTVFRKNVRDVLKFGAPIFWNVQVT
jgi:ABC-type transport system substrate-binding protein